MRHKQNTVLRVEQDGLLMDFLQAKMGGMAKASIKQLLSQRRVTVNNAIQTRHDTPIRRGEIVVIASGRGNVELRHPKLRIVYEDDALIVVEKKNGLLTVPVKADSKARFDEAKKVNPDFQEFMDAKGLKAKARVVTSHIERDGLKIAEENRKNYKSFF